MNHYEQLIADFLYEYKEVSLERIGKIKITGNYTDSNTSTPVEFTFDPKAITTPELTDYIIQKTSKSRMLITSDLESHLRQAREFINIGKTYEIKNAGFIKKTNSGIYEFVPASQALKAQKNFNKPVQQKRQRKKTAGSAVQIFTLLIVLAILGGLGWEAYQFFVRPKANNISTEINNTDSVRRDAAANTNDTLNKAADTTPSITPVVTYKGDDTINVKYIFETTDLLLRAQSRTAKLIAYGSDAGYDSAANGKGKLYSLYILKKTKVADTAKIKDSIAKFLQKPVTIKIASNK